ncbi:MAG: hypothetical protein JXB04_06330 [Kiritimatiellae bacterium]|nr:hypothetical protein [Kiritimatiellia bacterium]
MAEQELQHLIDRIRKEAIDTAEKEAADIVSKAKAKAAALVKEAEENARKRLEKADHDAQAYTARSVKTLEQAARDLLITVGQGVENILSDLVAEAVEEAMNVEVLEKMLVKIAEACAQHEGDTRVQFLIGPKDKETLVKFFAERYREKLIQGVELHVDNEIFKGFKVSMVDDHMYHDFTGEAIAEALTNFLRPDLAEIVHRVAREKAEGGRRKAESGKGEAEGRA